MMEVKKGIAAAEGIAIGRVFLLDKVKFEIDPRKIDDSEKEKEVKKVEDAIFEYKSELQNMAVETQTQQEVIDAHVGMLEDPFLMESIENNINNDNMNSELALQQAIDQMVIMMQSLDNEYLKERATDYKDIGQRLMYKLKKIEPKDLSELPPDTIIVAEELTPSDTSLMDKEHVIGFAMDLGGKTAHTSIIAQTLGIAAVVGLKDISKISNDGDSMVVDAHEGLVYVNPNKETLSKYLELKKDLDEQKERLEAVKDLSAITLDQHRVEIATNIGNIEDLELGLERGAEGVGLFRTEFLYMKNDHFPTEEEQFIEYKAAAELLQGKPLVIRTLDIGGDKVLSYFEFPKEDNPFLGWRALRICFDKEEVFTAQLRAILRASSCGNVKILLPMVISVGEIKRFREILDRIKADLRREEIPFDEKIEIGIMVETPASVFVCEDLIKYVDFFSIGTNDLTQYILACDRGNEKVASLYNTYNPAVLRAIKRVIDASHKEGKWTGMCGGFAGDTKATLLLLGMGLDEFSAPGAKIPRVKDIIRNVTYEEAKEYTDAILSLETIEEIEKFIDDTKLLR